MFPAEAKRGVEGPEEEEGGGRKVLIEDGFEGAVSKRSPYLQSEKENCFCGKCFKGEEDSLCLPDLLGLERERHQEVLKHKRGRFFIEKIQNCTKLWCVS